MEDALPVYVPPPKARLGRPSKLTARLAMKMFLLAKRGLTDAETATVLEISARQINQWKHDPTFYRFLQSCKAQADAEVVASLYQRATGYTYTTQDILRHKGGGDEVVDVIHHLPPDVVACIFWLKNRQSKDWRDRPAGEIDPAVNINLTVNIVEGMKQVIAREKARATDRLGGNGHAG